MSEHSLDFDCWMASYPVNKIVLLRLPLTLRGWLDVNKRYYLVPQDSHYTSWSMEPNPDSSPVLRQDGNYLVLTKGSTSFQPKLGYFGVSPCRGSIDPSETGGKILVTLNFRVPVGTKQPSTLKKVIRRVAKELPAPIEYNHIEPIPVKEVTEGTDYAFIKKTLDEINSIEAQTKYRLVFDPTSRQWTFVHIITSTST